MRAEEIKGLMEAYSKVHETSEVLSEEVIEISDEDLDGVELIEMTFEELEMLSEQGSGTDPRGYGARQARIKGQTQVKTALGKGKGIGLQSASTGAQVTKSGQKAFGTQLGGRQGVVVKGGATGFTGGRGARSNFSAAADTVNVGGQTLYKAKKGKDIVYLQGKGKSQLFKPGQKSNTGSGSGTGSGTGGTSGAGRGAGSSGAGATGRSSGGSGTGTTPKPTATSASKPAPAPAKPAGSAMDQWAAANPKLAAAKAERDRTRGTSATTNPLMKDMKSKLPAPSSPSPSTATTGFNLAKKGVNLAAGVDIFDLVKGHLLDEGYAETEENALVMMANMSEEWRKSILEAHGVELDEAQRARENPEKHEEEKEKEDEKKYGKVRGEKTPMPPRGDKRREDFEKWYAKHVR